MNDNLPGADRKQTKNWLGIAAMVLAVLAIVMAGSALYLVLREELAPEPETFQYGDQTLLAMEDMPRNPYDREAFSLDEKGRVNYEKDGVRAKTGVDVSFYQQEIDWQAVAADGIDFAIIRLGYRRSESGELSTDEKALANLQGASEAGLPIGAYFFSQAISTQEALEEAEYALSLLEGYTLTYPLIYDWEYLGEDARTADVDARTLTDCIKTFCSRVEAEGYESMIYFNPHFHENEVLYLDELTDYHFWLAMYDTRMDYPYQIDMWQYSCTGSVPGITGDVDLNLYLPRKQ